MFDDLKQQRTGLLPRERRRLTLMGAGLLAIGATIYFAWSNSQQPVIPAMPRAASSPEEKAKSTLHELDPAKLDAARTSSQEAASIPRAFDAGALEYVLKEVTDSSLRRTPHHVFSSPAGLVAMDPKAGIGSIVEVTGVVKSLDKEEYHASSMPNTDQLWVFALEGDEGARVVVVSPGESRVLEGGRPADAYGKKTGFPKYLQDGLRVRVRGVYLQRRTGGIGALTLDVPTPVVVGREFKIVAPLEAPPATLADVAWGDVKDRFLLDTQRVDDRVHYQLLAWEASRGHDAIVADLASGAIPTRFWGRGAFESWRHDLESDSDEHEDKRDFTNEARGKVFETTGILGDYLHEDWDDVQTNPLDVRERYKYWLVSDFYANALLMCDSAFPIETFKGVIPPAQKSRQKVRLFGIFVRNFSYSPNQASKRPDRPGEITVPYFVVLDIRPDDPYKSGPLWKNPFFWAWVSLALFGGLFFLIMNRLEKKESAMIREKQKLVRRGGHRAAAAGAASSGGGSSGGDAGKGSEPGAAPPHAGTTT